MLAVARATAALCALIGRVWTVCSGTPDLFTPSDCRDPRRAKRCLGCPRGRLDPESLHPVNEAREVEIDRQADLRARDLHVCRQLCVMQRCQRFHTPGCSIVFSVFSVAQCPLCLRQPPRVRLHGLDGRCREAAFDTEDTEAQRNAEEFRDLALKNSTCRSTCRTLRRLRLRRVHQDQRQGFCLHHLSRQPGDGAAALLAVSLARRVVRGVAKLRARTS